MMAALSGSDNDGMLTVVGHPLIQHRLSQMREKSCPVPTFRALLREIAMLLGAAALQAAD
jgi:uracil phosphoribosyltransferase